MKQRNQLARFRVYPRKIRALVQIAAMASEREVALGITASMLPRYDVFDMEGEAAMALLQPAVLTTILSPAPHESSQSDFHSVRGNSPDGGKIPLRFVLQDRNHVLGIHQGFVLVALFLAELAFIGPLRQSSDTVLNRLGYT